MSLIALSQALAGSKWLTLIGIIVLVLLFTMAYFSTRGVNPETHQADKDDRITEELQQLIDLERERRQ